MFCPKCGKSDQSPETYCRQCGIFLPDLNKSAKKTFTPEEHVKVNVVLSAMTVVAAFTLAILLYSILAFRPDTHPLIYVTAGVLLAIGAWQTQTLWRSILLKRHFKTNRGRQESAISDQAAPDTGKLLNEPDFENMVPASVTDRTTKHLDESRIRSSETHH